MKCDLNQVETQFGGDLVRKGRRARVRLYLLNCNWMRSSHAAAQLYQMATINVILPPNL